MLVNSLLYPGVTIYRKFNQYEILKWQISYGQCNVNANEHRGASFDFLIQESTQRDSPIAATQGVFSQ